MNKWLKKIVHSKSSCRALGHEWRRSSLRYNKCIWCGMKKRRGIRGVKND